jgi:hypothetical protein
MLPRYTGRLNRVLIQFPPTLAGLLVDCASASESSSNRLILAKSHSEGVGMVPISQGVQTKAQMRDPIP